MKILAFYLPQFHEIAENNDWWGKGFTDWTNVKKAKPLFDGHYQPLEPLNDNYYDLDDIEVMKWQSKIAQDHGVYGPVYAGAHRFELPRCEGLLPYLLASPIRMSLHLL